MSKIIKYHYELTAIFLSFNTFLAIFSSIVFPGGSRFFINQSSSMKPALPQGSISLVVKLPFYLPGDIITFYAKIDNREEIVAHRIYQLGGNVYLTKGDNNQAIDSEKVLPRLIIGKVIFTIPYLGRYLSFIKSLFGLAFFIYLPAFVIILNEINVIKKELKNIF